ncbi:MAG: hypothetical protein IKC69_07685 [Clostridia bacterium]|nr:hypothetical protein [Clostridia bacterium]
MKQAKMALDPKKIAILSICFVLGIIFLLISEYKLDEKTDEADESEFFDEAVYTERLQEHLAAILEEMEGVSEVNVMVTLESGIRYRYASETSKSQSGERSSSEVFLMMQEKDGASLPILTETLYPSVRGVSVVCRGAADPAVQRRIIGLVASTLNLNENQIFVSE